MNPEELHEGMLHRVSPKDRPPEPGPSLERARGLGQKHQLVRSGSAEAVGFPKVSLNFGVLKGLYGSCISGKNPLTHVNPLDSWISHIQELPISNPDRPVPTPRCCLARLDPSLPDPSTPFRAPETPISPESAMGKPCRAGV